MEKLLHIDTFAGIGGFSLAADRVFGEMEHIFCEIQPFCQAQLRNNWPKSKIYGDIRTLANTKGIQQQQLAVEWEQDEETALSSGNCFLLTGGFPCQPFSSAGQRKGTEDDRHLWPEMLRVIRDFRPEWIIGENVDGFVTWNGGLVLEQVCSDLEREGYEVQPMVIPACATNAPHRRYRVWIIAHAKSIGGRGGNSESGVPQRQFFTGKQEGSEARSQSAGCSSDDANASCSRALWNG